MRNGDLDSIGIVPFQDIIAKSRNVGSRKGRADSRQHHGPGAVVLYDMWQRLGIGRPTGIELGNESTGIVADPLATPWQTIDLVNRAFGQGVAVTPLQLARGFSAMINGGNLVTPHLVAALGGNCAAAHEPSRSWRRDSPTSCSS